MLAVLAAPVGARKRPLCVIADTIKGGSFMEGVAAWHHGVPGDTQFAAAMGELV